MVILSRIGVAHRFLSMLRFSSMGFLDIVFVSRVTTREALDCIFRSPRHGSLIDRRLVAKINTVL